MKKVLFGLAAALIATVAAAAVYVGFNPNTGLNSVQGTPVAVGTAPVLDATTSCGTLATVQASEVGGAGTFQVTANATTCTLVVDMPSAAPNGYYCIAFDETTRAGVFSQTAHSTTSCTVASGSATVVSGDKVLVEINGF